MEPTAIEFVIPSPPVAKGRPRFGANRHTGHAVAYTDKRTENYEALVCLCATAVRPPQPLTGPLEVKIVAYFDRPDRLTSRSKRTGALLHAEEGAMPHTSRPDLDNIVKAVLDGMGRAGIWEDDAQVCALTAKKLYVPANGVQAGVHVFVWRAEDCEARR